VCGLDVALSVEIVHVACPVVVLTATLEQRVVVPSVKVTVPPLGTGLTVAVNVTELP
jgi:hypothetical protein